mgnify:CR=1 FL=1
MAKYTVKFEQCGHEGVVELFGKNEQRARKIEYISKYHLCPECYKEMKEAEKAENCEEVEMKYYEYKKNYAGCKTKADSYNRREKTIVVYVQKEGATE